MHDGGKTSTVVQGGDMLYRAEKEISWMSQKCECTMGVQSQKA